MRRKWWHRGPTHGATSATRSGGQAPTPMHPRASSLRSNVLQWWWVAHLLCSTLWSCLNCPTTARTLLRLHTTYTSPKNANSSSPCQAEEHWHHEGCCALLGNKPCRLGVSLSFNIMIAQWPLCSDLSNWNGAQVATAALNCPASVFTNRRKNVPVAIPRTPPSSYEGPSWWPTRKDGWVPVCPLVRNPLQLNRGGPTSPRLRGTPGASRWNIPLALVHCLMVLCESTS